MHPRLDLLLPVNPACHADDRRVRICLTSLGRHLEPESLGRLLSVVPGCVSKASTAGVDATARAQR